jgi:hypothetical protein
VRWDPVTVDQQAGEEVKLLCLLININPFSKGSIGQMWARRMIAWSAVTLWLSGCGFSFHLGTPSPIMDEAWDDGIYDLNLYYDGVYTGWQPLPTPQFIVVDVAIEQGRIVAIHLREHPSWSAPQEQEKLLRTVIASQTTSAVTPRDEGSEQDHLLNAIEDALNKARQGSSSGP